MNVFYYRKTPLAKVFLGFPYMYDIQLKILRNLSGSRNQNIFGRYLRIKSDGESISGFSMEMFLKSLSPVRKISILPIMAL